MKSLSTKTFQCGVTVQGLTTLSGTVYLTALTNTATWDYVIVGTSAQGQLYTRTYAQIMSDITSGIGLSGYVPTSRTLTINGVSYDLTANRSWTITTPYVSKLQHAVKAGVAINKGQAVYVTSADGTNMIVGLASNASEATSSKTMGLLDATVSTNGFANVVTEGLLAGLDTSTANAEGDPVWLGTGGNLIYGLTNKPHAPAHLVFIGIVTRKNNSNGEIFVKVQNGFELDELHNVDVITTTPLNNHLLAYDYATSLWKNKTLGTVIGGVTSQYVKGDGTLGSFPSIGGGGGVVYYLNGGVASGVGGYQQMSTAPVLGAGTDFSLTGNGLVCQFLTDANSPSLTLVPPGAWRIGVYASMGTSANNSKFYVEILKYDGSTFTAIGSSVATPESVVNGTNIEYYTTTVAVSSTVLTITDRIAIRIYAVDNLSKTMTIHTENGHLCDIATTFPSGLSSINGLTDPSQLLVVGSSGSDFNITSSVDTHTFNIPTASASNRGLLSAANWTTFNSKQDALTNPITGTGTINYLPKFTGASVLSNSLVFDNGTNVGIGTVTPDSRLHIEGNTTGSGSGADAIVHIKQNGAWNGNEPWALYVEGYSYLNGFRVNAYDAQRGLYSDAGELGFAVGGNSPISFTQNTSDYRMYIAPGGNIGIGTTTPYEKLEVSGAISATGSVVGLSAQGHSTTLAVQSGISFLYAVDWGAEFKPLSVQAKTISLGTGTGSTTPRLFIDNSGNVGIGTTNPTSPLEITNTGGAGGGLNMFTSFYSSLKYWGMRMYGIDNGNGIHYSTDVQVGADWYSATKVGHGQNAANPSFQSYYTTYLATTSGNVGIGTTNPTVKLQVDNNSHNYIQVNSSVANVQTAISVTNSVSTSRASLSWEDGTRGAYADLYSSTYLSITTQSSEKMRITSGGNVGIGTSSPSYKLQVHGDGNGLYVIGANTAPYTQTIASFVYGGNSNSINIENQGGKASIQARAGGSTMDLLLNPVSGNVIIGTTSPFTIGGTAKVSIYADAPFTYGLSSTDAVYLRRYGVGEYQFQTTASGGNSGNLSLQSYGGSVGIGTTTPTNKLHVVSPDNEGIYMQGSSNGGHWFNFASANSNLWSMGAQPSLMGWYNRSDSSYKMVITDGGNVGIGTTSPGYKLEVIGTGRFSNLLQVNGPGGEARTDNQGINFFNGNLDYRISFDSQSGTRGFIRYNVDTIGSTLHGHIFSAGDYNGSVTDLMLVRADGNVGIGTIAPTAFLHITGQFETNYALKLSGTYGTGRTFGWKTNGGNSDVISLYDVTQGSRMAYFGYTQIGFEVNGVSRLYIADGGNIGIGTNSPSTKLDVSGVITATGGNSTNWNTAYGWGNHSSAGYVPQARTLTINGTSYDLSANRSWTISTATPGGSDTQFQYNSSGSLAGASALTYNSTTNRVGINQASPGYDLDVNGQVRVQDKLRVGTVNSGNGVVHMSSTATINANTTTIVWAQNVSVGMCAFIEYYILNDNTFTDQRAGTIIVTWNQTGTPTIAHTETTTPDIGSTTTINFTSTLVGSDARINAVSSSPHPYTMVMSYKYF